MKRMVDKDKKFIPIAYCPDCKKDVILDMTDMYKVVAGGKKIELTICACGFCDTVLNFDEEPKIKYISEKEANKMGWILKEVDD